LSDIFGVKYFAKALWNVAKSKDIEVKLRQNLIEILPREKKAVFQNLDTGERSTIDVIFYRNFLVNPDFIF
jgi:sulfide:quinone oxidoreductase